MTRTGVIYVGMGEKAWNAVRLAVGSLRVIYPGISVLVVTDVSMAIEEAETILVEDSGSKGRYEKTRLFDYSPFHTTLYMDADTILYRNMSRALEAVSWSGWDMSISPSQHQENDAFYHVDRDEVDTTYLELGYQPLQYQAGVFAFRRNKRVARFFEQWRYEWSRWCGQDQAAFVRALHVSPVKVWTWSSAFNGGEVVGHRFGDLR